MDGTRCVQGSRVNTRYVWCVRAKCARCESPPSADNDEGRRRGATNAQTGRKGYTEPTKRRLYEETTSKLRLVKKSLESLKGEAKLGLGVLIWFL